MKRFLFVLLLVMVGVFSVTAAPLHPPGESSLEMVMSDYGLMAMPATVLSEVTLAPAAVLPDSFLVQPIINIKGVPIGTVLSSIGLSIHDEYSQETTTVNQVILEIPRQPAGYFLLC